MSYLVWQDRGMLKNKRIILESELELRAGDLNAAQCRRLSLVYARWSRELAVKAAILDLDAQPKPYRGLVWKPIQKTRLN